MPTLTDRRHSKRRVSPHVLAARVNAEHPEARMSAAELRRWLVEAGYAELDQHGWLVMTEKARRLAGQAFA